MSKPSKLPRWATSAFTVTEPDELKKSGGYGAGEKPAPRIMNWLFNTIYGWCAYLSGLHMEPEFLGQLYTWTATHVFQGGIVTFAIRTLNSILLVPGADLLYSTNEGIVDPRPRLKLLPLNIVAGATYPTALWKIAAAGHASASGGACDGHVYVDLPTGCRIETVYATVTDVSSQPMTVKLEKEVVSLLDGTITKTTLATLTSSGAGALQLLAAGSLGESIENSNTRYRLALSTPVAAATIIGLAIGYDDPGFLGNT